ncbi:DNA starvation/stationary phase protection protein [Aetokthonos hydrillicola Thurmond2011]|jgi:starvation-inducible DNA-binding protein|uniref:DNA starvation/stationary phase protection protein n=1 Tax=Aetokthonos hydrillicola Thurmond2011 TaxID=2712845 RepID=A0AAP5IGA5_9CYAN|nr:Dps family protein [Aetokthonos hydrillicola]MBO3457908.1 DNA starvation/stationary phase protection protein [Aetokthonos hydrillicola CCALA 1050]MBW4587395.1 DNA starvation/stationary phase protection protein [Aetokthonos hydrillicola CCALA 1050]MDR9899964.1 DNA starvation/stationary phase protection protein [Aetokthonos hydrillicola Thurmond2011]
MRQVNIGLTQEQRQGVSRLLNQDLADAYLLLVKTKKYHWDVVGPQFRTLHQLWEEHYTALTETIDAIAERVRALGGYPIGTMEGFLKVATLKEHAGNVPTASQMVANLVEDHEQVIRNLRQHVDQCADEFHDEGTADFLTGIMEGHEEMAWMLRSFIEGEALQADGSNPSTEKKTPVGV